MPIFENLAGKVKEEWISFQLPRLAAELNLYGTQIQFGNESEATDSSNGKTRLKLIVTNEQLPAVWEILHRNLIHPEMELNFMNGVIRDGAAYQSLRKAGETSELIIYEGTPFSPKHIEKLQTSFRGNQ